MKKLKEHIKDQIAPSILSCNPLTIGEEVDEVEANIRVLHVDIMDGHFVPNHNGSPGQVKALKRRFPNLILDVHLMVSNPEDVIDDYIDAGADLITMHYESLVHPHRYLQYIRSKDKLAGLSLNPGTPVSLVENLISEIDVLLLMSVNPGFGGQSFIPETKEKITQAKELIAAKGSDTLIELDGGVKTHNAQALWELGADILVAGSAVFSRNNPAEEIFKMSKLRSSQASAPY